MELRQQRLNPRDGNESYLFKIYRRDKNHHPCIQIDSGMEVDSTEATRENEYISAILLTHPHIDHVASIDQNTEPETTVYAAEDTRRAIKALSTGDGGFSEETIKEIEILDSGWTDVSPGRDVDVKVKPFPAGHCIGAVSYHIDIDGINILSTGDFSHNSVAGWEGFPYPEELPEIDILCLNNSGNIPKGDYTRDVENILESGVGGKNCLVAGSETNTLEIAYLLEQLCKRKNIPPDISLVGNVTKLCREFDYSFSSIDVLDSYSSPEEVLDSSDIVISSGVKLNSGCSGDFFQEIKNEGGSYVAHIHGVGRASEKDVGCRYNRISPKNHVSEKEAFRLVKYLRPLHLFVLHGKQNPRYNELNPIFSWWKPFAGDTIVYREGWIGPPWLDEETIEQIKTENKNHRGNKSFQDGITRKIGIDQDTMDTMENPNISLSEFEPRSYNGSTKYSIAD